MGKFDIERRGVEALRATHRRARDKGGYLLSHFTERATMLNTIITTGFIIDEETGEILEDTGREILATPALFVPDTEGGVEWVLQLIQSEEAHIAGLTARRSAILENINSEIERHEKKREWVEKRFAADLEQFAKKQLDGGKSRTWRSPFGSLSFRKTPGSVKALPGALEWTKARCPEAIKITETVLVSELKKYEYDEDLPSDLFEVTPPGENFLIKTGVKDL